MNKQARRILFVAGLVTAAITGSAFGQQQEERLGNLSFPTSCDPKVQAEFERGVAMIHSYWFLIARRVFEGVLQQDPSCAIAYWGIAMDQLGNSLVGPPPRGQADTAWAALEKALEIGAKTERERGWIDALRAYFRDHDKVNVDIRLRAYNKAMEQIAQRYPDDYEVQVVYALTLQASASKTDLTYGSQLQSVAILEKLFEQNPQHPGVSHFIIHAYDFAPLADRGIAAAKRYASIAPAVPHARHMPSHIYSMVGMWEESVASNASALEIQPDYHHATDFIVYAHLQLGQDVRAKAFVDAIAALPRPDSASVPGVTAITAIPARYVLERGDWAGAAGLRMPPTGRPQGDSRTRFTRGLGMARSGDLAGAKGEVQAMQALRGALATSNQSYWAERTDEQMLAVSAWVALAEGATDLAVKLMRAAADGEDGSVKHVAMENRLYPMRELLGELLLQMGQAAPALREFEASLRENPNRYRGLYGAARAAEVAGDRPKATEYFEKLMALARKADTARPEIVHAKAFLGQR